MILETRGSIDYHETGTGPTVVLVPGSCSTGAAWRPVMAHWPNRFRCVTTSLLAMAARPSVALQATQTSRMRVKSSRQ